MIEIEIGSHVQIISLKSRRGEAGDLCIFWIHRESGVSGVVREIRPFGFFLVQHDIGGEWAPYHENEIALVEENKSTIN